jgi:hypothetical protein
LKPASVVVPVGQPFTIQIWVEVKGPAANAIAAILRYPPTALSVTDTTMNAPVWDVPAPSSNQPGITDIEVGATKPVTGNSLVASLTLVSAGTGNATITFSAGSAVVTASDGRNQLSVTSGASIRPGT